MIPVVGPADRLSASPQAPRRPARPVATRRFGALCAFGTFLTLWFAPTHDLPVAQHAIAISGGLVVLWATEAMDHAAAGLLGLALFWGLRIAPLPVILTGFTSESVWFLWGALVMGAMATRTGLAQRFAYRMVLLAGSSYSRLLLAFTATDFLLMFLIPSGMARVTILAAIVAGLVEALGLSPRSNTARGLLLVVTYVGTLYDKLVLGGTTSMLASGIIEQIGGVQVSYAAWAYALLPGSPFIAFAAWRLALWLFPAESNATAGSHVYLRDRLDRLGPWSAAQKRAAVLLAIGLAFWMTDFAHGLSPAVVAIGVVLAALLPRIGVFRLRDLAQVKFNAPLFLATALGMSAVLADSGGLEFLTRWLVDWASALVVGPGSAAIVLYWLGFLFHFFLGSEGSMISATLPAILGFATAHGLDTLSTGYIWTVAASGKIFAYQSGVLLVGYSYGYFTGGDLLKFGLLLSVVVSIVLWLLVSFYWPLISLA